MQIQNPHKKPSESPAVRPPNPPFANFINKLIQSHGSFHQTLPVQQIQQNTLIKLASILYNKVEDGPFGTVQLQKLGRILKILGQRAELPKPLCYFVAFDNLQLMEMLSSKYLPQDEQDLAFSIYGLYPQVRVDKTTAKSLPLFIPELLDLKDSTRIGNRNWQLSRSILEQKFKLQPIQLYKTTKPDIYLCYQILLCDYPLAFRRQNWIIHIWSAIYKYYYQQSMNLLIEAYRRDLSNPQIPIHVQTKYIYPLKDLRIDFEPMINSLPQNNFDRLSIQLIKIIVQKREDELDLFLDRLMYFIKFPQYEEGILSVLSILYKRKPSDSLKEKILWLAKKRSMLEMVLPLVVSDKNELVAYYTEKEMDDPKKIILFQQEDVRAVMAENIWQNHKQKTMDLIGSFKPEQEPFKIIESIPHLSLGDLSKALNYFKNEQNLTKCRKILNKTQYSELEYVLKLWNQMEETLAAGRDNLRNLSAILKFLTPTKQSSQLRLQPPFLYSNWLLQMLNLGFDITESLIPSPEAIAEAQIMFLQVSAYIDKILSPDDIRNYVFNRLATVLGCDQELIKQLRQYPRR